MKKHTKKNVQKKQLRPPFWPRVQRNFSRLTWFDTNNVHNTADVSRQLEVNQVDMRFSRVRLEEYWAHHSDSAPDVSSTSCSNDRLEHTHGWSGAACRHLSQNTPPLGVFVT